LGQGRDDADSDCAYCFKQSFESRVGPCQRSSGAVSRYCSVTTEGSRPTVRHHEPRRCKTSSEETCKESHMAKYQAPLKDARFVLNEVFAAEQEWATMEATSEVNAELAEAILEEGARVTQAELLPLNLSGDAEGARFEEGRVTTPKGFKEAYRVLAEGGWMGLGGNPEYGGQGMPKMLTVAFEEMLYATNTSFALYPALNAGACLAMDSHAPESVKRIFLPRMYAGDWLGTMCLTEPHCGTDLGMIRTRAEPLEGDDPLLGLPRYRITGTKIWITGGEHDMVDNIVHLVLAKLPDAPSGTRGIECGQLWVHRAQDGHQGQRDLRDELRWCRRGVDRRAAPGAGGDVHHDELRAPLHRPARAGTGGSGLSECDGLRC
jgi:hypothetical protein